MKKFNEFITEEISPIRMDDEEREEYERNRGEHDNYSGVMATHFAGDDDFGTTDPSKINKVEITELDKYKNCIKDIKDRLTNIKKEPYDYGEATDEAISDVLDMINTI